jgi:hypothetical protein
MIAQYLVVGLIVLLAAGYAASKYLPLSVRRKIVYKFSDGSGKGWLARYLRHLCARADAGEG